MIKKVKSTLPWTYFFSNLNGEEILKKRLKKKELQKAYQKEFIFEQVINRKGNNLYAK